MYLYIAVGSISLEDPDSYNRNMPLRFNVSDAVGYEAVTLWIRVSHLISFLFLYNFLCFLGMEEGRCSVVHLGSFAYISVFSAHIFPTPPSASEDSSHCDTYQMIYEHEVIPAPPRPAPPGVPLLELT